MTDGRKRGSARDADLEGLARRFCDLWQDQLAAMAVDPEFADMMGKWFGAVAAGAPSPGAAPGSLPAALPGMLPGPAGPFGAMDPMAWLKALGIEAPGAGAGRNETADAPTAAKTDAPPPAGTPSPAAPSRPGDAAAQQFERRLADLERRLDRLEAALGGTRQGPAKRTRKRRS